MTAVFLRLLGEDDKGTALEHAIRSLRSGVARDGVVYRVDPAAFGEIPGSPFAYWASARVRRLFRELPPFESEGRTVKQGLATADDFRFVRAWWEVPAEKIVTGSSETTPTEFRQQTFEGKKWVPIVKSGASQPWFSPLTLLVNWERDGEEIKNVVDPRTGRAASRVQNTAFYFRAGFSWTQRAVRLMPYLIPTGCIPSVSRYQAYVRSNELLSLGLAASNIVTSLLRLYGEKFLWPHFLVENVKAVPWPVLPIDLLQLMGQATAREVAQRRSAYREFEPFMEFEYPVAIVGGSSTQPIKVRADRLLGESLDSAIFEAYGLDEEEKRRLEADILGAAQALSSAVWDQPGSEETEDAEPGSDAAVPAGPRADAESLSSYSSGCAFGRWDLRFATGERETSPLSDPFAPLPACSPGMLTGADGLPLRDPPTGYPLAITSDGILVDDPDHADDVVTRVRAVLDVIWGERAAAIEREACKLLGVKELREYFRNPRLFFDDHIKRYSRGRRKAPIYWLLQSSKRSYGLWLYLHRLNADTLFKALERYVGPKLALETQRASDLRAATASMPQGPNRRQRERDLERQDALASEVADFKSELERVARLGLAPDLDDGVVLTIAPLHKLVPWKEAERYWKELLAGKYPWSSIAKQLREKGIVR